MGHLQSKAFDASQFPAITALGELYRGPHRSKWKYKHDGGAGCCVESLLAAHNDGTLQGETHTCGTCPRIWQHVAGWWVIPQRKVERRPIESLRHGRAGGLERQRNASKREAMTRRVREPME